MAQPQQAVVHNAVYMGFEPVFVSDIGAQLFVFVQGIVGLKGEGQRWHWRRPDKIALIFSFVTLLIRSTSASCCSNL